MIPVYVKKEIKNITQQIIAKYKPQKIILFGSAARGKFGRDSDVDLLVIKKDVPRYGIDRMRQIQSLVERNIALDILVYKPDEFKKRLKMGDPFIKVILKEGRVLYD